MLQNIRQLAGEPPELTGNAAADTAALNRWHRKLQAAKKRLERGRQNG